MTTLAITCFGFLALLNLVAAEGSVQNPNVTQCEGSDDSYLVIQDVKITDAELGKTAQFDVKAQVNEAFGVNPVLKISFAKPEGRLVQCVHLIIPKQLKLCGGDTEFEKQVTAEWNNKCPIEEGTYSPRLSIYLPDMNLAKGCIGDGKFIVTLTVADQGKTLDCVSFPVSIDGRFGSILPSKNMVLF
nr:uncharacterized protein LOC129388096 [Dermacentor andersoni]